MTPEQWQRVEAIYHAACEVRAGGEREAFLAEACRDDHALRFEVEGLLGEDAFTGILDGPAVAVSGNRILPDTPKPEAGTLIGPYQFVSPIGTGGMGEVWEARDTRLDRAVAVKIAPQQFSGRFEGEAHAIAALNHSNICTIYDVGPNYLVMELVEGPTLAERIRKGPVPLDEALGIAMQVAEALETAHAKGIIHRDLKPANIKLRPDGVVKVLDFGLAKATGREPATSTDSPTLSGMILGTPGYMAPEQARGETVDKRADIWSFGVVLYEMLTGKRLFTGKSISETLAAVLTDEPEWERVPKRVHRLLRRCLEKDPKRRLRDISGVALLLEETPEIADSPPRHKLSLNKQWVGIAGTFAALAAGIFLVHFRERPARPPVVQFTFTPPDKSAFRLDGGVIYPIAVSPDGSRIVFSAVSDGKAQLWVRSVDRVAAQPLPGTEDGVAPFWSPDSRYIGFGAGGKLKKIDLNGGRPVTLADAPNLRGGAWNWNDTILFAPGFGEPLRLLPASGGVASHVATRHGLAKTRISHSWPRFLPDQRHFVFSETTDGVLSGKERVTIRLGSLDSADSKILLKADSNALYTEGHLLFLRNSMLRAQRFDVKSMTLGGDAVPVVEPVQSAQTSANGVFSASENGLLVYAAGDRGMNLTWFDRGGTPVSTVGEPGTIGEISLSPDRKNAAASVVHDNNADIWTYDLVRGIRSRLTTDPATEVNAVWSPDGRKIIFNSSRKGQLDLYVKASDGTGPEELIYADDLNKYPSTWSPDGKSLLYITLDPKTRWDLWVMPLTPEGKPLQPYPWLRTQFNDVNAEFSPDGKWLVYQSSESGSLEIYVAPFGGASGKRQVSVGGGVYPRWRRDGKEIFYVRDVYNGHSDKKIMAVDVSVSGAAIDLGKALPLFGPMVTGRGPLYDVAADGQRFLAVVPSQSDERPELTVVQNWMALLSK